MKGGDLVRYDAQVWPEGTGWDSQRDRVGIVVEIHYRGGPTAVVRWNGIKSALSHRQDLLEVVSESR